MTTAFGPTGRCAFERYGKDNLRCRLFYLYSEAFFLDVTFSPRLAPCSSSRVTSI